MQDEQYKYDVLSQSTKPVVWLRLVIDIEYFLFWFRPIKMRQYKKSRETIENPILSFLINSWPAALYFATAQLPLF